MANLIVVTCLAGFVGIQLVHRGWQLYRSGGVLGRQRVVALLGLVSGTSALIVLLLDAVPGWIHGPAASDAWARMHRWTLVPMIGAYYVFLSTLGGSSRASVEARIKYAAIGEILRAHPVQALIGFVGGVVVLLPLAFFKGLPDTPRNLLSRGWMACLLVEVVGAVWWLRKKGLDPVAPAHGAVLWPRLWPAGLWGWACGVAAGFLILATLALASPAR